MENYFDFYQIPLSYNIDMEELKKKYYEMSKKFHPDFYASESEAKQAEILELSTYNTNAFNTLKDNNKRLAYILRSLGLIEDKEEAPKMTQTFLAEMMDINEKLMELDFATSPEIISALDKDISEKENTVNKSVEHLLNADLRTINNKEELEKLKDFYFKRKYILRIRERLNNFASRF